MDRFDEQHVETERQREESEADIRTELQNSVAHLTGTQESGDNELRGLLAAAREALEGNITRCVCVSLQLQ